MIRSPQRFHPLVKKSGSNVLKNILHKITKGAECNSYHIESAFSETFSILARAEELVLREIVFDE